MLQYIRLFIFGFVINFLIRFSIIWIPGLILMALATKGSIVYCVGIALIMFAAVVAIIEEIKILRMLKSITKSGPEVKMDGNMSEEDVSKFEELIKSHFPNAEFHHYSNFDSDDFGENTSGFKEVYDSEDTKDSSDTNDSNDSEDDSSNN